MTGKEILLKALKFEETPRLPVGVLDGYAWILNRTGKSFQDLFDDAGSARLVAEHYRLLQSDIAYMNGHVFNVVHRTMGGTVQFGHIGESVEITAPPLAEIGDYTKFDATQVMQASLEAPEYRQTLAQAKELASLLGQEKLVAALSYAPFTVAGMLAGVQNFMAAMFDDEDETLGLVDFAADLVIQSAEAFVACGAEAVFLADPVASGDLISPDCY